MNRYTDVIYIFSHQIYDTQFAGVPVRIYQPKIPNPNNTAGVVFVHGGGFVLFDVNGYDTVAREISRQSQMITVSIDYRLAPEAPFPAGLNDVRSASTHFLDVVAKELGLDPERIAIVGDSAGGNLAAATVQWMKRSGRKTNFKVCKNFMICKKKFCVQDKLYLGSSVALSASTVH